MDYDLDLMTTVLLVCQAFMNAFSSSLLMLCPFILNLLPAASCETVVAGSPVLAGMSNGASVRVSLSFLGTRYFTDQGVHAPHLLLSPLPSPPLITPSSSSLPSPCPV